MKVDLDSYWQFDKDLRACNQCKSILALKQVDPSINNNKVEPRPIISGIKKRPIMLIGQAPGIKEYETGKPFQGQAGQDIRQIFGIIGVKNFDEDVWPSAVVKCYPGRKIIKNKKQEGFRVGDEVPTVLMIKNCQPFLMREIGLIEPKVIVTLGSFPLKVFLGLQRRPTNEGKLESFVGRKETWERKTVIFFPHTSGSSRWLNSQTNKQMFQGAQQLLRQELINFGIIESV